MGCTPAQPAPPASAPQAIENGATRPTTAQTVSTIPASEPAPPNVAATLPTAQPLPSAANFSVSPTVAVLDAKSGLAISSGELLEPLIEAHGLDILLRVVYRDMARQQYHLSFPAGVVTPEDFAAERKRKLAGFFETVDTRIDEEIDTARKLPKDKEAEGKARIQRLEEERQVQHQQVVTQMLQRERITEPELELFVQTNTYLRKIAEPQVVKSITEDLLHKEFGGPLWRKSADSTHPAQPAAGCADRSAGAGGGREIWGRCASTARTTMTRHLKGSGCLLLRDNPRVEKVIRDVAFSLQVGQVSDLINADNVFHLIKLEERIPPRAIKYESERDILFADVREDNVRNVVNVMWQAIAAKVARSLHVNDPTMSAQWEQRLAAMQAEVKGREQAEEEMAKERDRRRMMMDSFLASTRPATAPAASRPASQPASKPRP